MLAHRFADGAEDHAGGFQRRFEGGGDRDAVEHRVHRDGGGLVGHGVRALDPGQDRTLLQRDAELLVHGQEFRVHVVEALGGRALGGGVVVDVLKVDLGVADLGPVRLRHLLPGSEGAQAPFEQPVGLVLLGGDHADGVGGQALGGDIHLDVGLEPPLVAGLGDGLDGVERFGDGWHGAEPYSAGTVEGADVRSDALSDVGGTWCRGAAMSAMVRRVSACITAWFTGSQRPRTGHSASASQLPAPPSTQAARAMGPSMAVMTSAMGDGGQGVTELVAAAGAALAPHQAGGGQGLEHLRHCRLRHAGHRGDAGRGLAALRVGQADQHHDGVVGELRQPQHGTTNKGPGQS